MAPIAITPEPRNGPSPADYLSVPSLESISFEKPLDQCPEPIAIVGMACRLPGDSGTPSQLWDLLMAEKSGQCGVPKERFNIDAFYHPNSKRPGSMNTAGGYFINEDIRQFENGFFGINNLEATYMDPQQRKLLEVVYECFESAGATLDGISGANIGCYVGNFTIDFQVMQTRDPEYLHRYAATGMGTTILGNRISHAFNLTGPSFVLDTACSSSLYCLHSACVAVSNGECRAAIVAGANLITSPEQHIGTMKAGVLSATSTCHTFDASADGYGRADGIGALYIKKLSDALKDGDPIRAIIRGTATNSNGKTPGITLPSADGQEAVIRKAYLAAGGLDPNMTSYVECHGTGTPVGDPIEVEALSRVFSEGRSSDDPLLIGSVKTNLGHSEAASGISSLIKVVMALENGTIPATIGVKKLNPKLKMDEWNMKVVTKATEWPSSRPVRRAGVNSFGYGGANSHAILESVDSVLPGYRESRNAPEWLKAQRNTFLLPFSASNESSMRTTAERIATRTDLDFFDLAYTLGIRRTHFSSRGFVVVDRKDGEGLSTNKLISSSKREAPLPLAFIFTGQGAQCPQMGKELMEEFPSFLRTIRELDGVLQELPHPPEWTLEDAILEPAETSMIHDVTRSQPVCTALQIALVQFLDRWGMKPTAVTGHSSGEIAAAYTAGLLTASQAIIIAYYRGHVVGKNTLKGAMMAAGMDQETAQETINSLSLQESVVVACVNSPESVTLSGDRAGIEKVLKNLQAKGKFARNLNTGGRAYHSHHMKAIGEEYQRLLEEALGKYPEPPTADSNVRMISSVTGATAPEELGPSYWRKNLESPVLFYQAVEQMAANNQHIVEIGPHSALQLPIKQIRTQLGIAEEKLKYSTALTRGKNSVNCVLSLAGNLFLNGHNIDFAKVNSVDLPGSKIKIDTSNLEKTIVDLPPYKWEYGNILHYEPRVSKDFRNRKYPHHDLLGSQIQGGDGVEITWRNLLKIKDVPWLEDHKLEQTCVFPGAGYLAMAVEAISQISGRPLSEQGGYILRHININKALVLPQEDVAVELFLTMHPERISSAQVSEKWFEFNISSLQDGNTTNHCSGKICFDSSAPPQFSKSEVDTSEFEDTGISRWYKQLILSGLNFGTAFQSITQIQTHKNTVACHAIAAAPILKEYSTNDYPVSPYIVHPITLDACLQTSIIASTAGHIKDLRAKVPVFIEHCHIRQQAAQITQGTIESTAEQQGFGITKIRASLRDQDNNVIVEMSDVRLAAYEGAAAHEDPLATRHPCLRVSWKPDISRAGSIIPESYLKTFTVPTTSQPCVSENLRKMLAVLDLLAHKEPMMRILELGGDEDEGVSAAILDVLGSSLAYKRLKSYATGRITEEGIFTAEDSQTSKNMGFDPRIQEQSPNTFDLIILPNVASVNTYLTYKLDVIKRLLSTGGHLLAALNTAGEYLENNNFSIMRVSPKAEAGIILARQTSTPSPSQTLVEGKIYLIVDSTSNPFNQTLASMIHSQTGVRVKTLTLRDCNNDTIPRKAKVISTVELEKPFLAFMTETEMTQLKAITDNASELIWVTGGGALTGKIPELSLVSGLSRAMMLEQPSLRFYTFDIDNSRSNIEQTSMNILSVLEQSQEFLNDFEFVQKEGIVHVSRFIADEDLNSRFRQKIGGQGAMKTLEETSQASLKIEKVGLFDTIYFQKENRSVLKDDFVEVDVKAVGLNAKDVYVLAGKVATPGGTCSLDYSGVIRRVGSKVINFKTGDRVVVMAPGWFKTTEQVPEWACQKMADGEDFNTVSTLGVVYSTALYGLRDRARLQAKETVLIHSGAGGLGIAAIEVALMMGAEIFTTVSTDAKKDFLVERFGIPRDHIFSSRNSSFVEGVLSATGGRGVDVVLNSLIGDLLHDTWRCCAPFGRFVEVGKRDILDAGKLDMQIFSRNSTFTAFDLSELYNNDMKYYRDIWSNLLRETMEFYRARKFRPFPQQVFDVSNSPAAFRSFSSGTRIGKIVVSFQNPQSLIRAVPLKHEARFSPDKSYLMIGCLGGLGRSLSKWMISRGAKRFVFLGRSGADRPVARKLVDDLESFGAIVRVVRGDVGVRSHVEEAVEESELLGPIGGVVQGAMGLSEALFTTMTNNAWHTGIQPKLVGSFNLHNALLGKDADLEFFLMTSSVSGSVGTATESNYCAANGFLDAFARYRRRLGKPATSVGLGMISEVGYLHENPEIEALLLRKGIYPLPEEEFIQVIDLALADREPTSTEYVYDKHSLSHILTGLEPLGLIEMRRRGFEGTNPILTDPRASILAATLDESNDGAQNKQHGNLPAELVKVLEASGGNDSLLEAVLGIVTKRFSNLVLIPVDQVDIVKPLSEYGMDSMIAAEFRTWFYVTFKVDVPFLELLSKSVTVRSLSELVNEEVSQLVL